MSQRCDENTFSFYIRWTGKDKGPLIFQKALSTDGERFKMMALSRFLNPPRGPDDRDLCFAPTSRGEAPPKG